MDTILHNEIAVESVQSLTAYIQIYITLINVPSLLWTLDDTVYRTLKLLRLNFCRLCGFSHHLNYILKNSIIQISHLIMS